jgi:hypothetical protein
MEQRSASQSHRGASVGAIRAVDTHRIVIVRLDRTIQYSGALAMESKGCAMQKYPPRNLINRRIFSGARDVFAVPASYLLRSDNQHGMGR